ncbi:plasmid mobilization protein [Thalassotalea agarivorans]|uniref:Mobilisation protein (MobC) n=1 Tax=Thalassotalea agarivorans TaxID=349064 RepID=A0A1I0GJL5_THASX|nr:plasmid mobilization relaxosome protein MobC [Thalassotalea agarivorans]SET71209.1 mobilisation protein (MobC) [Thalassotalea agarivorans]
MDNEEGRSDYFRDYRKEYDKQNKYVNVRLEMKDFKRLEARAKKLKKPTSTYLRELAFAQLDGSTIIPPEFEEGMKEHNRLIRNIANNLNQIAHQTNIFHEVDQAVVFQHLRDLDAKVQAFIEGELNQ